MKNIRSTTDEDLQNSLRPLCYSPRHQCATLWLRVSHRAYRTSLPDWYHPASSLKQGRGLQAETLRHAGILKASRSNAKVSVFRFSILSEHIPDPKLIKATTISWLAFSPRAPRECSTGQPSDAEGPFAKGFQLSGMVCRRFMNEWLLW